MSIELFFGRKRDSFDDLVRSNKEAYPSFRAAQLKQVHGNTCLQRINADEIPEGDGHWTTEQNLALFIATADCLPILVHDPLNHRIAALHAGWRGVAKRIVPELLQLWKADNAFQWAPSQLRFFVGPHIHMQSFEVGLDVQKQLLESFSEISKWNMAEADISYLSPTKEKAHVNLGLIVRLQAMEFGCEYRQWEISSEDTKTSTDLASFRRDGAGAGRNWSAIYLR